MAASAAVINANNNAADLGDLTYDPNAVHRLAIQLSGFAPGTGTGRSARNAGSSAKRRGAAGDIP